MEVPYWGHGGADFSTRTLRLSEPRLGDRVALVAGDVLDPPFAASAFAGVAALVFDPHIASEIPAVLVMAVAAMTWGGATLLQRRLSGISVMNIQAWNGLMGAAVLLPVALVRESGELGRLADIGWEPIGWFAFSVIGSTVAGQGALAWLLQRHPISSVMPLLLASPVMATVFASLYFGTRITPVMIAGGLLALVGVAMIVLMKDKAVSSSRT